MKKIRVGIIGTGNIGTDLLIKCLREDKFNIVAFVGRRLDSNGMKFAKIKNISCSEEGINFFIKNPNYCDVVYDCTNAVDASYHSKIFKSQKIKVIDLTPSKMGPFCIPSINDVSNEININMITCGGQASLPLLNVISKFSKKLSYIEVVSQIASDSAGLSTRINIDNYINTTESAIKQFTGTPECKVILNLNSAVPQVDMQTTMFVRADDFDYSNLVDSIYKRINKIKEYIPYYELVMPPVLNDNILVLSVKVKGSGDYLPPYAGNLDIINCAAIEVTKRIYE
jgi:acetaldehyde dehydrogenase